MIKMKVQLTFLEPLLGTTPGSKEIAEEFIGSKHPSGQMPEDEEQAHPEKEEVLEKATTFFSRNNGNQPILWNYQIEGFFKDACGMLKRIKDNLNIKLKAHKKVIDGLVFVHERQVTIIPPKKGKQAVKFLERPLRAQTLKGERIALVRSEVLPVGSKVEFTIAILEDSLLKHVKSWLDYGRFRGLGQWRNSGMGRFEWKLLKQS